MRLMKFIKSIEFYKISEFREIFRIYEMCEFF